jgi:hypothetical protein
VTGSEDTVARDLLAAARALVDRPSKDTSGMWPRAAVFLARQALEVALKTYWSAKAPGVENCPTRAQLLCLGGYLDGSLAQRGNLVWAALSRASHHHPYDLPPTHEELVGWCDTVLEIVERTERAWR